MSTDVKGSSEAEQGPGWRGGAATGHKARLNPPTQVRGSVPGFKGTALAAVGGGEGARCETGLILRCAGKAGNPFQTTYLCTSLPK